MPPPLRVLHVFPTFAAAGSQRRTVDLVAGLGPEFQHAVLALDGVTGAAELLPPGTVRLLEPPPKAGSVATARRLGAILRQERPDLLCTYNFGSVDALLAARWRGGPPALHHEDGFHPDEARGQKRRRVWLRRLALPAVHRLVVVSRTLERIALGPWRQPRERVLFVPNGIDLARFARANLPADLGALWPERTGALVVGCVGHLRPEKNVARLFAAAALAVERGADIVLLVVGDGPERAALEAQARRAPLAGRVHFTGHVVDPRAALCAMHLFALTSDTEQMPISLLEAMAAGLGALATDVGDVRHMVPEAARRLVEPIEEPIAEQGRGSVVERLAAHLVQLAGDRNLVAELGAMSCHRARDFDRGAMLATYRGLYLGAAGR